MPDPFEQLRSVAGPADPDPAFAARLRARLERALSLPKGVTVSNVTNATAPSPHPDVEPLRAGDLGYVSLWVPDERGARAFYGAVLGWAFDERGQVAGVAPHHGLRGGVADPTLLICITTDDVARAAARVQAAGGHAGAASERDYGIVADCTDDQGMPFALWQPTSPPAPRPGAQGWRQGDVTYVTLEVIDSARFRRFFTSVAGWEFTAGRVEDGWEARDVAPMCGLQGGYARTTVVPMYVVDNVDAAVERVRTAGGTATPPERQPYGVSSNCSDDQGTRFYLIQY